MPRIGPYEIIERIGVGGMAEVFLAKRETAGISRLVVIKRVLSHLSDIPEVVQMALQESKISARLNHPNIVALYEVVQLDGAYCLIMEYVEGATLEALLSSSRDRGEQLPVAEVVKIGALICEALDYAHRARDEQGRELGLIHRDVSPDNVLLGTSGAVKLTDFGIAKVRSLPSVTRAGTLKGKTHYSAPEYLRGLEIDRRADLYGLGVVLYEALTGEKPFDAPTPVELMRKVMLEAPRDPRRLRPELPPSLSRVLLRALEKEADARYPDARAMQADLDAVLIELRRAVSGGDLAALVERYAPRTSKREPTTQKKIELPSVLDDDVGEKTIPAPPRRRSAWAAAAPAEPGDATEPPTAEMSSAAITSPDDEGDFTEPEQVRTAAREAAFAAADAKLSPEEEAARAPSRQRGEKRELPLAALIAAMAVLGLTGALVLQLMPKPHRVVPGAKVHDIIEKRLSVTSNVPGADVFVREQFVGKAPLDVENAFPFGERVPITGRAFGFPDVSTTFTGGRGQKVELTFGPKPEED